MLLLSGCVVNDIKTNKVPTISAKVLSTNRNTDSFFTLMPIVTSTGKTTTTTFVPMYQEVDSIKVKYKFHGKVRSVYSEDFDAEKTSKQSYVKLRSKDLGKQNVPIVIYVHQ